MFIPIGKDLTFVLANVYTSGQTYITQTPDFYISKYIF